MYELWASTHNNEPDNPDWQEIDGVWACPVCDETAMGMYNPDEGVVGFICDEHPDAKVYIGKGLQ